jgi:hypothetical protein
LVQEVNQTVHVTWVNTNATECVGSGLWSGEKALGSGAEDVNVGSTTGAPTLYLTCTGPGGTALATQSITVIPTCTFTTPQTPVTVPSAGQSAVFQLNTGTECSWTVSYDSSIISNVSLKSGTGPVGITYDVGPNHTGAVRTTTITFGNSHETGTLTINQSAGS